MNKLLELEKKLKEMREELQKSLVNEEDLSKIMSSSTTATGSVNTTGRPSIGSQIGFPGIKKAEDKKPLKGRQDELDMDKDGDIEADDLAALREKKKKMKKADHEDEKEDKKLIAEALDRHNEKKHGEAKDKDSAKKDIGLNKKDDEGEESAAKIQPKKLYKSEEQLTSLSNGQWVLSKSEDEDSKKKI